MINKIYSLLDELILPWPVKFLTNPLVILITFSMLIPLIGYADTVVFVLVANSYMNVASVGTSSIVLRQQLLTAGELETRNKQDHIAIMSQLQEIKEMHKELKAMHQEISERLK
jgi:hypothetical protein